MSIKLIQSLLSIGAAAFEFLKAENEYKMLRHDYETARNEYMAEHEHEKVRYQFQDWVEDPKFQMATKEKYGLSVAAKRKMNNAKKRLNTRFKKHLLISD